MVVPFLCGQVTLEISIRTDGFGDGRLGEQVTLAMAVCEERWLWRWLSVKTGSSGDGRL